MAGVRLQVLIGESFSDPCIEGIDACFAGYAANATLEIII